MMCTGPDIVRVRHAILHEPHGGGLQFSVGFFETSRKVSQRARFCRSAFVVDNLEKRLNSTAAILRQLAADQIHCLHAVGAFIDHGDPGVADILFHAPFANIAMSAIDLLRVGRDFIALVRAISFDHRCQQRQQVVGHLPFFLGLCVVQQIGLQCAPQT